jgi:CRISPR-associated protein Csm1
MINNSESLKLATQAIQEAISDLIGEKNLPDSCKLNSEEAEAVQKARKFLGINRTVNILSLLFDRIKLPDGNRQKENHYVSLHEIVGNSEDDPKIPYPIAEKPSLEELQKYQDRIATKIKTHLNNDLWNDLSFLSFILEKYGSCVSYGDSHTALVDAARMTAAVAVALSQNQEADSEAKFHLVAGSLSGIQNFIYTISSDGALKSLRARSFYLELVAEEIVQQILEQLKLPRTNVIYAGGGNLFILAGKRDDLLDHQLKELQNKVNEWLEKTFQDKIFLSLDYSSCSQDDIKTAKFRDCWNTAISKIAKQKNQKFRNQIQNGNLLAIRDSHQPCKVCHRDDTTDLKPLNKHESDSPLACITCREMFKLGDQLPNALAILRTNRPDVKTEKIEIYGTFYYVFESKKLILNINPETDTIYCINNWEIENYRIGSTIPMLMGRYYQPTADGKFITAEDLAESSQGIKRVGYLRMDVDRLGQIFAHGLDDRNYSLPRVASLSRQMSYFFKVYLNNLAYDRANNLPEKAKTLTTKSDKNFSRRNLMFIYAGGDDLFISGAWNEVVEFAFDIYQSFQAYTGNHPDITISGGISIDDAKFPLYQSADSSGEAEKKAKGNGRDSLGLFGAAFKWNEWIGSNPDKIIKSIKERDGQDEYWKQEKKIPVLAGVIPFVKILIDQRFGEGYSRAFVRNLLKAAQLQEQKLEELRLKNPKLDSDEARDLRYYLHLPQIAYTISRLPKEVKLSDDFRRSLMSPYNALYFRAIATWIELLNRGGTNQ